MCKIFASIPGVWWIFRRGGRQIRPGGATGADLARRQQGVDTQGGGVNGGWGGGWMVELS